MKRTAFPLKKLAALSVFILSVSAFVSYRSGFFENEVDSDILVADAKHSMETDDDTTIKPKPDTTLNTIMYSSKSLILVDPPKQKKSKKMDVHTLSPLKTDSLKKISDSLIKAPAKDSQEFVIASTSKSAGFVIRPRDLKKTKKDNKKTKKQE